MADCLNCKTALSFKKILKSLWLGYQDIECSQCKTIHEHKFKNRIITSICMIPVLFIVNLVMNYFPGELLFKSLVALIIAFIFSFFLSVLSSRFLTFKEVEK
jgi:CXXC-20-CXXC protein